MLEGDDPSDFITVSDGDLFRNYEHSLVASPPVEKKRKEVFFASTAKKRKTKFKNFITQLHDLACNSKNDSLICGEDVLLIKKSEMINFSLPISTNWKCFIRQLVKYSFFKESISESDTHFAYARKKPLRFRRLRYHFQLHFR